MRTASQSRAKRHKFKILNDRVMVPSGPNPVWPGGGNRELFVRNVPQRTSVLDQSNAGWGQTTQRSGNRCEKIHQRVNNFNNADVLHYQYEPSRKGSKSKTCQWNPPSRYRYSQHGDCLIVHRYFESTKNRYLVHYPVLASLTDSFRLLTFTVLASLNSTHVFLISFHLRINCFAVCILHNCLS